MIHANENKLRQFRVYGVHRHSGKEEFLGTIGLICYGEYRGLIEAKKTFKGIAKKIRVVEFQQ